ncbi:hypothetical protein ABIB50_003844 [Mucilaginibacter sp. UYCu711]
MDKYYFITYTFTLSEIILVRITVGMSIGQWGLAPEFCPRMTSIDKEIN